MELSNLIVILVLVAVVLYQQWFFMRQVHRLIDKLMSRSFAEYQTTINPPAEPPRINLSDDPQEDLRVLG